MTYTCEVYFRIFHSLVKSAFEFQHNFLNLLEYTLQYIYLKALLCE